MSKKTMTIGGVEFNLRITFLIILSTIVPMLDYYRHTFTATKAYDRIIYYLIIPLLVIVVLFRESPSAYGFQWGNWRVGLTWTAVVCFIMSLILWFAARTPGMHNYYSIRAPQETVRLIYLTGVDLLGWEFMWRGLMLFALAREFGPGPAIFLQAVPFAFMHLGKPELEALSTIFGGAGFGFIAWQSESFVYPWLIHWFIASVTMLIATGKL